MARPARFVVCGLCVLCLATAELAVAQYIKFDSVNDTISIPGNTTIGSAITIEARIRFCSAQPSAPFDRRVFQEQHDSGEDKALTAGTSGLGGYAGVSTFFSENVPVSEHVWHHIAFVRNVFDESLYLDGVLASSRVRSGPVPNSGLSAMSIGAFTEPVPPGFRDSFLGVLDTVRVSNIARYSGSSFTLPAGDLTSDANTLLLYNFNDSLASPTVADSSANGFTGTLGTGPNAPTLIDATGLASCESPAIFHYSLAGPGAPSVGKHWISLPRDIASPTVSNCFDLLSFIPNATSLSRYDPSSGLFVPCTCPGVDCFSIVPGQGYQVVVSALSTFQLQGDEGSFPARLAAPPTSSYLISLPFGTPLATANDLAASIGGFTTSGGPVQSVTRYVSATDTLQVRTGSSGPNFLLETGVAYRVQVTSGVTYTPPSFGGDFCDSDTTCFFDGLANEAFGNATLALTSAGDLEISNISSAGDFVTVDGTAALDSLRSGHEDWIPLGMASTRPVSNASTSTGSRIEVVSHPTLGGGFGPVIDPYVLLEKNGSGQIEISADFSLTGATTLEYIVFQNGVQQGAAVTGQPMGSIVEASDWPLREAPCLVQWAAGSSISFVMPDSTMRTGDELEIIPEDPDPGSDTVVDAIFDIKPSGAGLGTLSMTEESFITPGAAGGPAPTPPTSMSFTVTVSRSGTGTGTVTSSVAGISCGADCTQSYTSGTALTLTPTPAPGSVFISFSGDSDCSDGMLNVTDNRSCTANFLFSPLQTPGLSGRGLAALVLLTLGALAWALRHQRS